MSKRRTSKTPTARGVSRGLDRIQRDTEAQIHAIFTAARVAHGSPAITRFALAYDAELKRQQDAARAAAEDAGAGEEDQAQAARDARVPLHWLHISGQGDALKTALSASIGHAARDAGHALTHGQGQAVQHASDTAQAQIGKTLRPAAAKLRRAGHDGVKRARDSSLHALIGRLGNGKPLAELFDTFGGDASKKAQRALIIALMNGRNPRDVAYELAHVLDVALSRALTIARTELLGSWRDATSANYRANDDVLDGWVWMATLDDRCCIACLSMHGTKHSTAETMDAHVNCRCAMAPLTKSWGDLFDGLGIDTSGLPDTRLDIPDGAGLAWFEAQDEATQRTVLSPAKYAAWKSGALDLGDLLGVRHDGAWGRSIYEASLRELGLDASDYLD